MVVLLPSWRRKNRPLLPRESITPSAAPLASGDTTNAVGENEKREKPNDGTIYLRRATLMLLASHEELPDALVAELRAYGTVSQAW
jgi:hypothetical protein